MRRTLGLFIALLLTLPVGAQSTRRRGLTPVIFGPSPAMQVGKGIVCGMAARDGTPCEQETPAVGPQDAGSIFFAGPNLKVMLFGGESHDVYLGCLSCYSTHRESILNPVGPFGSTIGQASLMNHDGPFGGAHGRQSACNPYATAPPVIVDQTGRFYGYLTVSEYKTNRNESEVIWAWLFESCKDR